MDIDFARWLEQERKVRGWSPSELSRHADVSRQTISDYENRKRRYYDEAILVKLARAFKLPPETVFRAAGLLPPQSPETELIQRIIHLTSELPEQDQAEILEYAQLRHRLAEQRGKNETKGIRKIPAKPKQV